MGFSVQRVSVTGSAQIKVLVTFNIDYEFWVQIDLEWFLA